MTHHPNYRVSVEIILKKNDKILLAKRSEEAAVAPGVWNVPAGKVKFHEIPLEAAYRELKEETNLNLDKLTEIHVRTFEGNTVSEPIYRLIYTYVADITDAQLANFQMNDEHSEYVWVSQDELNDESYNSLLSEFRKILKTIF
ncbi:NUDIX hydrolase [Paenisporosarcina macmurdoensis]|uniref:NUDIX hydrolase n=1 Tax=Paenisporosarcina macmurdoensis TaxID=212659 RepID=A0ABW1L4E8_9BACL